MRKIVSTSTAGVANTSGTQCNWITTAVCDDGSVWWLRDNDTDWRQHPPIPQADQTIVKRTTTINLPGDLRMEVQHEPVHGVDATPDSDYIRRILTAHLELQQCVVTADPPSPIADVMNYACERRAVLLAHALQVLSLAPEIERRALDAALARVDTKWQSLMDEVSGKTPVASACPPTSTPPSGS